MSINNTSLDDLMNATESVSDYELERGKPMPSLNHSVLQLRLGMLLAKNYAEQFLFASELSLSLADKPFVPDLCIYPKRKLDWQNDEIRLSEPPLTIIEISSPKQDFEDFQRKLKAYFDAGVKSFWLVIPFTETLTIFYPNEKPISFTTGEAADKTNGIRLNVDELFAKE
ncbi:MAG: Uma2 family endonuclease [Chloroherpetonaceae bacterium]